jgi:hypothetical protein
MATPSHGPFPPPKTPFLREIHEDPMAEIESALRAAASSPDAAATALECVARDFAHLLSSGEGLGLLSGPERSAIFTLRGALDYKTLDGVSGTPLELLRGWLKKSSGLEDGVRLMLSNVIRTKAFNALRIPTPSGGITAIFHDELLEILGTKGTNRVTLAALEVIIAKRHRTDRAAWLAELSRYLTMTMGSEPAKEVMKDVETLATGPENDPNWPSTMDDSRLARAVVRAVAIRCEIPSPDAPPAAE